jgi:serine/threonine-protein phosphatase 2A activator
MKPKSIHNKDIIEEYSKEYMYLSCIKFVNHVKTESLSWHSPMLNDISGVKTWKKVNEGMIKMYQVEVLGKLPIMQHFRFGSLLPFEGDPNHKDVDWDHVHAVHAMGQEFPTCCGIRIPSAIAAASLKNNE